MLILSRRNGQSIRIGDDIVITVLELGRDQVRIGVHAPRSTSVHREEVYEEIMVANRAAAGGDGDPDFGAVVSVAAQLGAVPQRLTT